MNKEELTQQIESLCEQISLALEANDLLLMDFLLDKFETAMAQLENAE